MTLFSFVTLSFVDTMYPTNVHSNWSNVMCIDSGGSPAWAVCMYNLRGCRDGADEDDAQDGGENEQNKNVKTIK